MEDDEIAEVLDIIGDSEEYVIGMYGRSVYIVPFSGSTEKMVEYVKGEMNEG